MVESKKIYAAEFQYPNLQCPILWYLVNMFVGIK